MILQLPEHTAETAPNDVYTRDFSEISRAVREERDWVCEKCGTSLASPDLRKYLHVHHVDGRKWNNERRNLRVLCIACHSEESDHGHLKSSAQYKEYIRFKRSRLVV